MRKAHEKQTKVDLTVPIIPSSIIPDEKTDCFGTELYNPQDKDCSICSDIEICGIKFQELVKAKKKKFEDVQGPTLDMSNFEGVNMPQIMKLALKYQQEGNPMTIEELQDIVQLQARTKDQEAVLQFISRELPLTSMYIKNEHICVRTDSNS